MERPDAGPPTVRVRTTLWPRQQEAFALLGLDTPQDEPGRQYVEELLFGGASGGGKSALLRQVGIALCLRWPGAQIPLFRKTYPELSDTHIRWILREVAEPLATYVATAHELRFANGSVLMFRHCEDDLAVRNYLSSEWSALLIDQAEEFPEDHLRQLRARVRQPVGAFGGKWRRVTLYSANPGGISHLYLREGFVRFGAQVHRAPESDGGWVRAYLPSRLKDNPSLDYESYRQTLLGHPPHLVSAYLEGNWDFVARAYFSQWRATDADGDPYHVWPLEFAREFYADAQVPQPPAPSPFVTGHLWRGGRIVEPAELEPRYVPRKASLFPPEHWPRWAGVDGGIRDPWCALFLTRAPDGRVLVYDERWGIGDDVPVQARIIRQAIVADTGRLEQLILDPSMFNKRANLPFGFSDAQVYAREGLYPTRGNNNRKHGWRRISELLSQTLDDGYPALVVLEGAAPQLVRTLPVLLSDRIDRDDVSADHGRADPSHPHSIRDDSCDALRYAIVPAAATSQADDRRVPIDARDPGGVVSVYDDRGSDGPIAELGQTGLVGSWR